MQRVTVSVSVPKDFRNRIGARADQYAPTIARIKRAIRIHAVHRLVRVGRAENDVLDEPWFVQMGKSPMHGSIVNCCSKRGKRAAR